jgi:hypothetical protein
MTLYVTEPRVHQCQQVNGQVGNGGKMNVQETIDGLDLAPTPSNLDVPDLSNAENVSPIDSLQRIDSLQLSAQIQSELTVFETEIPNIALDEQELATLNALIQRYDQVIHDLDLLNDQIENLLAEESIKGCDS